MTLPKGWASAKIADVAIINPKHPADADRSQRVSFVPMPAVDEELGAIVGATDRTLEEVWTGYTHFAEGDVIFAKITPCMENGKAAVAIGLTNGLACGSTEFYVLRPDGVEASLLWRFLRQQSFRAEAERNMSGAVGQRRVPRSFLEEHPFALPPAAEQRRIVAKLDALTTCIARARAELRRVPVLSKNLRATALRQAYDLARLKAGTVPIREMLSSLDQGWSPKCENYPSQDSDEWAVLKTTAVQALRFQANENKVLPSWLEPRPGLEVAMNDILVTRAGPRVRVGISCVVKETRPKLILADKIYRLRADPDRALPDYVALMLNAPQSLATIETMKTGISDSGLNLTQDKFLALEIPAIDRADQEVIIESTAVTFARADRLEAEAARARALLDRLEAAILAKAFRGELVPQDPNDEPASVLLERIRAQRAGAPNTRRGRGRRAAATRDIAAE